MNIVSNKKYILNVKRAEVPLADYSEWSATDNLPALEKLADTIYRNLYLDVVIVDRVEKKIIYQKEHKHGKPSDHT